MVSRQDHGELMCWVSVDQALKQATRVKNSLCLSRQDHVDQVLKQATRVTNSLCLSRVWDGVFRRASGDQDDIHSGTWYGHGRVFGDIVLKQWREMKSSLWLSRNQDGASSKDVGWPRWSSKIISKWSTLKAQTLYHVRSSDLVVW